MWPMSALSFLLFRGFLYYHTQKIPDSPIARHKPIYKGGLALVLFDLLKDAPTAQETG